MNKILVLVFILLPVFVFGKYPFSKIDSVEKLIELSNDAYGNFSTNPTVHYIVKYEANYSSPIPQDAYKLLSRTGYSIVYNPDKEIYKYLWIKE